MPDCSKGLKSRAPSRSGYATSVAGGAPSNRGRCRNCEILEARINNAKQGLRELKRDLRRKVREFRNRHKRLNAAILTIFDICNPAFMRGNRGLAIIIIALAVRCHDDAVDQDMESAEQDTDFQDEDEE